MFSRVRDIKKFTTKEKIDYMFGNAFFQIKTLPIYYYGNGFFVAYVSRKFRVECDKRIEYGEEGMYAISVYHFKDIEMLKANFGLDYFEVDDIKYCTQDVIEGDITYDISFKELQKMELKHKYINSYMEGERRRLIDGKMRVINLFIMCGSYTFFFYGKSKNGLLSGFEYVLTE